MACGAGMPIDPLPVPDCVLRTRQIQRLPHGPVGFTPRRNGG